MEIKIGHYMVKQRTEYSKMHLINTRNGCDITDNNRGILEKILDDYREQTLYPEDYLKIKDNSIIGFHDKIKNIDNLFIPEGITKISEGAFTNCSMLRIHLPETLEKIEKSAFSWCIFLKELYIPETVKQIGSRAFENCYNLEYINLPSMLNKLYYKTFFKCTNLNNVVLPDKIELIDDYAFAVCSSLTNIQLPRRIKGLGFGTFSKCTKLENINLPYTLDIIDEECFADCKNLKEIKVPNSVMGIGKKSFLRCEHLTKVILSKNIKILHANVFDGCKKLNEIILSDNITNLQNRVVSGTNIKAINIPKCLNNIEDAPFVDSNVKELIFNHDLKELKTSKFDLVSKTNINKLIINNNVKTITPEAFCISGSQITSIDYLGTEEEFNRFKNNNKELFEKYLTNIKEINFIEKPLENSFLVCEER